MKKMILDEVARFRQLVRVPQGGGHAGQGPSVPIPASYDRGGYEEPRPHEVGAPGWVSQGGSELERDLQGLDGRR